MKNHSVLYLFLLFLSCISFSTLAQSQLVISKDQVLKDSLYNANRVKVLNYSMKEFDALFFEFFQKKANPNLILSKKEFYSFTIKIAAFSDRLASLYPTQKEIAAESKKKWMSESYEDYLLYKASQKK
ncbi:MAG: hypothetical protein RIT22_1712 [Bacteroidota bacterium]|jgi:hypothetical protein